MQMLLLIPFLKLILLFVSSTAENCDRAHKPRVQEGNLGQTAYFKYIGLLIVHIREFGDSRSAMTGIVLIKDKYALANADDVVKIPEDIFKNNTRAMFIRAWKTPRFFKVSSYVTHPEYPHSTLHSIVIIELNLPKVKNFQLTPICLPTAQKSRTSRFIYLAGITDENHKLEKILYKIQYLDKKSCEDLYNDNNTAGVPAEELLPSAYTCGYAPNIATACYWENGMALVSNATGVFNLIGLAVYGPGCAMPARFMDLSRYLSWIHSVTRPAGNDDDEWEGDATRSWNKGVPNVPIHTLFKAQDTRRQFKTAKTQYERYPFNTETLKFHIVRPTLDNRSIIITTVDEKWEKFTNACQKPENPTYKEYFEVRALDNKKGSVTYKLELYDMYKEDKLACVRFNDICKQRSDFVMSFREEYFPFKEDTEMFDYRGETAIDLFKYFPVLEVPPLKGNASLHNKEYVNTDTLFRPSAINADHFYYTYRTVNKTSLYVRFEFYEKAYIKFELFSDSGVDPNDTDSRNGR